MSKIEKQTMQKIIDPAHANLFARTGESEDLYYFCRKLQAVGEELPDQISRDSILPLMVKHGWADGTNFKIDIKEQFNILCEVIVDE